MSRCRFWCIGVGLFALFVSVPARSQGTMSAEELGEAIQVLKDTADREKSAENAFRYRLARARKQLVDNRQIALKLVVALLDENETQIRLNAAISLAEFADGGENSQELIEALKRCLRETNAGITYWGLQGLTSPSMPAEEKLAAIVQCMSEKSPQDLRIAAAYAAQNGEVKQAVPWLIGYMKLLLPDYRSQVQAALVVGAEAEPSEKPGEGELTPALAPDPGRPAPFPRRAALPPAEREPARRLPRAAAETGQPGDKIDPDKLTSEEAAQNLIQRCQRIPVIQNVHKVGLITEDLVRTTPLDSPFGFSETPPWALDRCVEKAVAWLEKHRAEFPPAPAAEPAPAPMAKPAPAPAAKPAPAAGAPAKPAKENAEEQPKTAEPEKGKAAAKPS